VNTGLSDNRTRSRNKTEACSRETRRLIVYGAACISQAGGRITRRRAGTAAISGRQQNSNRRNSCCNAAPCRSVFRRIARLITTRIAAVRRYLGASHDPLVPRYCRPIMLQTPGRLLDCSAHWNVAWSTIMVEVLAADFKIIALPILNFECHAIWLYCFNLSARLQAQSDWYKNSRMLLPHLLNWNKLELFIFSCCWLLKSHFLHALFIVWIVLSSTNVTRSHRLQKRWLRHISIKQPRVIPQTESPWNHSLMFRNLCKLYWHTASRTTEETRDKS